MLHFHDRHVTLSGLKHLTGRHIGPGAAHLVGVIGPDHLINIRTGGIGGCGVDGHIAFNDPWVAKFNDEEVVKHEQGHTKQSYILGWLYLLVIGLPSLIWANCFGKFRRKYGISYYAFYTEKTANILGGVDLK